MAIIETSLLENLDETVKISFDQNIASLIKAGAQISFIRSNIIRDTLKLASTIYSPEAYGTWKHLIEENPSKMHPPVLERFRSGASVDGPEYVKAWQDLEILRQNYITLTDKFDITLAPTTPILPPKTQDLLKNNSYFSERNLLTLRNTRLANLMGLPSLSLPTEINFCGLMLMGKPLQDIQLLSIGKKVESILKR